MIELDEPRTLTLADGVEESLLHFIRHSGLTPGSMLPKEVLLAEKLKVSRHVVREGLSRLKTLGVIDSRRRRGMMLARPQVFAGVEKVAEARLFTDGECRELMGLRVVMELGMAEFIYHRKTPELLAELRKYAGLKQSYQEIPLEIAFHTRLFAIGGNAMADEFQQVLVSAFHSRNQHHFNPEVRTPTHREICNVLEQGTEEEFRKMLRAHFEPYTNW